jgi:hypothetical protein
LFASVDDSIGHLSPELRSSIEELCAKSSSLWEAIRAIRLTIAQEGLPVGKRCGLFAD